jgi:uncharacterized protein YbgA (DUF1722 family)
LFTLARLRELGSNPSAARLVAFHASHKLLFMACGEKPMRLLGRIVANPERLRPHQVMDRYEEIFRQVFARPMRRGPAINTMVHAFGHFSGRLTARERQHFLRTIERYRGGGSPVHAPLALLRSWIERFGEAYLERQVFFDPYPEELIQLADSGKGREMR